MPGTATITVGRPTVRHPRTGGSGAQSAALTRLRHGAVGAVPVLGMLFAAALVISRRPDAVTHAQFWGEDGGVYYANVYAHGLLATIFVPIAGYLQVVPALAAAAARPFPLAQAPLVTNLIGIGFQVLPVGLLLCARASTISRHLAVRALLAALYIAIPGAAELNATVVNAQWHLAIAAALVLMLAAPRRPAARFADGAILVLSGLTGPFCLVLAPLAVLQRRSRGQSVVPNWALAVLGGCAALQTSCILYFSHHTPPGFIAGARPAPALHATPALFWQIVGGRVFAAPVLGQAAVTSFAQGAVIVLVGAVGLLVAAIAARTGPPELRLFVGLGAGVVALALARPLGPWWMLTREPQGERYFVIAEFGVLAVLVWGLGRARPTAVRVLAGAALAVSCAVAIPREWSYAPFTQTPFAPQAAAFARAPRGSRMVFVENPAPWRMVLTKH